MQFPIKEKFKLSESFIESYKRKQPKWGFSGLSEFVFMRTYSRIKENGKNEMWWETVKRVVEGIYSIQKQHINDYNLGWNQAKSQASAREMYERIFSFKMLGSGRSLWAMGSPTVMEKGLTESLFNCSYISTEDLSDAGYLFANMMDLLMLGVGVGTDVRGANTVTVHAQKEREYLYEIPDSREGWVEATKLLINSFFGSKKYIFDYSLIRPAGAPIKGFGGVSSGYIPLKKLHDGIAKELTKNIDSPITQTTIANISNLIGVCVVAGNIRRSAILLLGNENEEFVNLKNYEKNPERITFGWASNNSILAKVGQDYSNIVKGIKTNGEPGIAWIDNFKHFGRMREDERSDKDRRITGANPCMEVGLESHEFCNLSEIAPSNHTDINDFKKTLKYAYLFAKSITLLKTNWADTNKVLLRNRRIGVGLTGITQFIAENNIITMEEWMNEGYDLLKHYDSVYSDWFAIPKSIKMTTLKPSGSLSLLAGVTAGVHYPQSNFYIRRVRVTKNSPFIEILRKANYNVEPAKEDPENTMVVEFPVKLRTKMKTVDDVSVWEQMLIGEFCQKNWSDNGVSITVTFTKEEEKDLLSVIEHAQFKLKGISFLPKLKDGAYEQMPYETISEEKYLEISKNIKKLLFKKMEATEVIGEKYCETDVCELQAEQENILITINNNKENK